MSKLREVLAIFEERQESIAFRQLAQALAIDPAMLEGMLDYWVRKGKLRATGSVQTCTTCGIQSECPFIAKLPRYYELVRDDESENTLTCGCTTCR